MEYCGTYSLISEQKKEKQTSEQTTANNKSDYRATHLTQLAPKAVEQDDFSNECRCLPAPTSG